MRQAPLMEHRSDSGRYRVRMADSEADIVAAQILRAGCFHSRQSRAAGRDADRYDPFCQHVLVEDDRDGTLACTFRVRLFGDGGGLRDSYAAGFYDLSGLGDYAAPVVELGRFCIRPGLPDADILRVAWGRLSAIVNGAGAGMLIGCSSFPGTDPTPYRAGFALLAARHLAPCAWRPGRRAQRTVTLGPPEGPPPDPVAAARTLPSLLRSYLGMGGRVSDHAVIDDDLGTLHVFTGLEISAIPPRRVRALRALAG
ncbi:GNAT family N-acetyltransferase [Salibaculum griseiflavum]|nr:GNAT family N-acetyltransferase [Salibaculum griseiflavum]